MCMPYGLANTTDVCRTCPLFRPGATCWALTASLLSSVVLPVQHRHSAPPCIFLCWSLTVTVTVNIESTTPLLELYVLTSGGKSQALGLLQFSLLPWASTGWILCEQGHKSASSVTWHRERYSSCLAAWHAQALSQVTRHGSAHRCCCCCCLQQPPD
jgi:hypothetical protein